MKKMPSLGELEIQVMRWVWQLQPCTERQITELVQQDRSVGRTTVLKTMQRLEAKGLLARVPGPGPVRFRAVLDQDKVLPTLIGRFVDGVLGGSAAPLLAYLAGSSKLSWGRHGSHPGVRLQRQHTWPRPRTPGKQRGAKKGRAGG